MLLEADGLAEGYEKDDKLFYEEDVESDNKLPFSLKRLKNPGMSRNFDWSNVRYGGDVVRTSTLDINEDDKVQSVTTSKDTSFRLYFSKYIV